MKPQRRLCSRRLRLICACLMSMVVCPFDSFSQPAPVANEGVELLELPSFAPVKEVENAKPVTLELLSEPSEEKAETLAVTPGLVDVPTAEIPVTPEVIEPPEQAAEVVPSIEKSVAIQVSDKPFGPLYVPPASTASVLDEEFGPKFESASTNSASISQLENGDPRKDVIKDGWDEGSVMFSRKEIGLYREALLTPKALPQEVVITQAPRPDGVPAPPEIDYPAFFVHSILYHKPKHWSVWMNRQKFSAGAESPMERIEIIKVTHNRVTFRWKPANKLILPEGISPSHIKQEEGGDFLITLAPNQTLIVEGMRVLEGRALTAEVKTLLLAAAEKAEAAKAAQLAALAAANNPNGAGGAMPSGMPMTPPQNIPNPEQSNVNTMIEKYKNVGLAK